MADWERYRGPPLRLAAAGKAAGLARQTTLHLTPLHRRAGILKRLIASIDGALQHVKAAAGRSINLNRWGCLLRYISDRRAAAVRLPQPPPRLAAWGQLPDRG